MNVFEELGISDQLIKAIKRIGITKPTQIQGKSIPHIIQGKDVIGESATGSGKTLAYGCGIVEHVVPGKGLQALIMTPTRELAEQVKDSLVKLSYEKPLNFIAVYGGVGFEPQVRDLKRSNVVVATPGRLLDHLSQRTIDLSKVKLLVLDEADRMVDMGFIDDVKQIIKQCPGKRQTLFFSATISPQIVKLADQFMVNPEKVFAENRVDPSKLKQVYYNIDKNMKISLLIHLLQQEKSDLVMVFCNSRKMTDFVSDNLRANKVRAIAIHGGLTQNKRLKTIEMFNEGKVSVLVCTDVAARGLHIDNVSHIYNYDIPKDANDYVHRIGRTARAGEEGKVINLLCDYDHDNFSRVLQEHRDFTIEKLEKPYIDRIRAVGLDNMRRSDSRGSGRFGNSRGSSRSSYGSRSSGSSGPRRFGGSRPRRSYQRRD